jgi:Fungal specific transcription factor domain
LYHTILLLGTLAIPNHDLTWPLSQTVNGNAPQLAFSAPKSVHLVQALLLLAMWPQTQLQGTEVHDHAWMYASSAVHIAQCIGLHRSFISSEYTESGNTEEVRHEWVRTWVGCFIVTQLYDPHFHTSNSVASLRLLVSTQLSPRTSPFKMPRLYSPL